MGEATASSGSAWAQVINGCRYRDDHLELALLRSDAMDEVGRTAVFLCLEHTLGLQPADLDPEEDPWGWTDGLDELFDQRLDDVLYDDSGCFFRFTNDIDAEDDWGMDWFRIGDRGWITGVAWDHSESREVLLGSWTPFGDLAARRRAAQLGYMSGWWDCGWLPHGQRYFHGEAGLLIDCLSYLFSSEVDEAGSGWMRSFCWPPPEVDDVSEEAWTYLAMKRPARRVWPSFDQRPPRNLAPDMVRELVAMYLASRTLPSEV